MLQGIFLSAPEGVVQEVIDYWVSSHKLLVISSELCVKNTVEAQIELKPEMFAGSTHRNTELLNSQSNCVRTNAFFSRNALFNVTHLGLSNGLNSKLSVFTLCFSTVDDQPKLFIVQLYSFAIHTFTKMYTVHPCAALSLSYITRTLSAQPSGGNLSSSILPKDTSACGM